MGKRYFIFVYEGTGNRPDNSYALELVKSNLNIIAHDGKFPARELLHVEIKKKHPMLIFRGDPLISNYMELSEEDWNNYNTSIEPI